MIENYTKGIKALNKDATCRGFKFEEGKTYEIDGELVLCNNGFHFCPYIACTLEYYPDIRNNLYAEVEAIGDVIYEEPTKIKAVTNKIKIVRFLSKLEIQRIFDDNNNNTGDWNTGSRNTGSRNTGHWNTGDSNTGSRNTGDWNTGDWNTGDWNTGDSNTGSRNTGSSNTGDSNTGDWNTGDSNTGRWNTGDWNTGDWNTGSRNTGDWNTGDRNTGDWNTGHWNTGYWNTGHWNTGYFNTDIPLKIRVFNKEVNRKDWEECDKPSFIYFKLNSELGYKGSFRKAYNDATLEDKLKIFNIPNFDKELFFEISGIDVTELEEHLK